MGSGLESYAALASASDLPRSQSPKVSYDGDEFSEYIVAIGLGFLVIPIVEIVKFFQRLAAKKKPGQN